jgi:transposase
VWPGGARDDHAHAPDGSWRTRPTPAAVSAPHLRRGGITAVIPEPLDQIGHRQRRGSAGGRPVTFDAYAYRLRNSVERAVNKLRGYRGVATRFDKRDYVYRGTVDVATIGIWLRDPVT